MLEELHLAGLGVIDDAVLPLGPGFTVVTGETGAGKTMVVTGLGLLYGGRADSGLVRTGSGQAVVEGRVAVRPDGPAARRALEAGADLDGEELLLVRTVAAGGRSRAHVGGRAVPVSVLGELAEHLVAVHGQSDQQRLLRPAVQRHAVDRFAGAAVAEPLARWREAYDHYRDVVEELARITGQARERAREADLLRFGLEEVAAVDPQPGEDVALATRVARLAHADALRRGADAAREVLSGSEDAGVAAADALSAVAAARRALAAAQGHDPALDALAARVAEVSYLLSDVAADLASYASSVDADPAALAAAQERQAALSGLLRKYGDDIDGVLDWARTAARRLAELDGDDGRRAELAARRDELLQELAAAGEELTAARGEAADRLGEQVTAELAGLAMPHARLRVEVNQHEDGDGLPVGGRRLRFGPEGLDEVELLLEPHAGAPARALARGASGGELSRVMLAVEVVLAGTDPVPTFVFDEVDAGVGGRAAVEVGRRLARLARSAQVLVVTHLPQVAAFADRHLVVTKDLDGAITSSGVRVVDGEDRLRELSRMLSGLEHSELGRDHAEELLSTAAAAKAATG